MKKTYISPELEIQSDEMALSILAGSPVGFNNTLDNTNTISADDMLGRDYDMDEEE